jgi:hypothetical protein
MSILSKIILFRQWQFQAEKKRIKENHDMFSTVAENS